MAEITEIQKEAEEYFKRIVKLTPRPEIKVPSNGVIALMIGFAFEQSKKIK